TANTNGSVNFLILVTQIFAGRTSRARTFAGRTSRTRISAGRTSSGRISAGRTSVGRTLGPRTSAGRPSGTRTSARHSSSGRILQVLSNSLNSKSTQLEEIAPQGYPPTYTCRNPGRGSLDTADARMTLVHTRDALRPLASAV